MRAFKIMLPLFLVLGMVSGTACWALHFVLQYFGLSGKQWIIDYYPAVVLGFFVHAAGAHAIGMKYAQRIPDLVILVIASVLGWRLAIEVGYDLGGPMPFVNAGALGALVLALGSMLAWRIRARAFRFLVIITAAGTLGGLVFHYLDAWFISNMHDDDLWMLILFAEWQSIFMAGVAVALHAARK
ncbi:MAG TPA: hypothetical protein VFX02_06555 [Gammaproteobacteria bacterium]|nr:hypothetical protein [Gammaproteobacteria bacterium]